MTTKIPVKAVQERFDQLHEKVGPQRYVDAKDVPEVVEWQAAPIASEKLTMPAAGEGLQLVEADMQPVRVRQLWFHRCPICGRAHHNVERPQGPTRCYRCNQWLLPAP